MRETARAAGGEGSCNLNDDARGVQRVRGDIWRGGISSGRDCITDTKNVGAGGNSSANEKEMHFARGRRLLLNARLLVAAVGGGGRVNCRPRVRTRTDTDNMDRRTRTKIQVLYLKNH